MDCKELSFNEKNRFLFWTLVAEDIARILIEVKVGEPLGSELLPFALHYSSQDLLAKIEFFALSLEYWPELDRCFSNVVEEEKEYMNPFWRRDQTKNPTAEDDPLSTYTSGHPLLKTMQSCLKPFLLGYLGCISEDLVAVFQEMEGDQLEFLYHLIFKMIRFLYCNYYHTIIDSVHKRGPCVLYALMDDPAVRKFYRKGNSARIEERVLLSFAPLPYLYGDACWLPSIAFWKYFPAFDGIDIPFSRVLLSQIVPWRFPRNDKFTTFAKKTGSVLWLQEGCAVHANSVFTTIPTRQETFIAQNPLLKLNPHNINVVFDRALANFEEILMDSRSYDQSYDNDDFAFTPLEQIPNYFTIDLGRITHESSMIEVRRYDVYDDIHWGFIQFEVLYTVKDGNCFYHSLLQTLDADDMAIVGFLLPDVNQPEQFKRSVFTWLKVFYDNVDNLTKWLLNHVCITMEQSKPCEGLYHLISMYSTERTWGSDALAIVLSIMLKTNIVLISAKTGHFVMTAQVIDDIVTSKDLSKYHTEEDRKILIGQFGLQSHLLLENTPVFLLHCSSLGLYVGDELRICGGRLDHYVGLSFAPEMGNIDTLELMNHLLLMRSLLFDSNLTGSKLRWSDSKKTPSQNCVPHACEYYNKV